MFGKDQSFQTLTKSIKAGDVDEAFRAAHTMKGMCQNMAFTRLYQSSHDITETLRGKDLETAKAQINIVTKDYNRVLTGIYKLLEW
jgi:HPt (histidine-containing phosphotransfer) domain-containing protein